MNHNPNNKPKSMATLLKKQQKNSSFKDRAFKSVGDLIKLLPSGTVFLFQFLNPLLTNNGHCNTFNKYISGALLAVCGFSCAFSTFTDSYVAADGRVYYGIATRSGLWVFAGGEADRRDLSKYKLRVGDFVHAALSVVVFAAIALLDANTVGCFYAAAAAEEGVLVKVVPAAVGGMASAVFVMFPNERHGIGYPPATSEE